MHRSPASITDHFDESIITGTRAIVYVADPHVAGRFHGREIVRGQSGVLSQECGVVRTQLTIAHQQPDGDPRVTHAGVATAHTGRLPDEWHRARMPTRG